MAGAVPAQNLRSCGKAEGEFGRQESIKRLTRLVVAAYVEQLTRRRAPQTVKQHLAAIRMLFDGERRREDAGRGLLPEWKTLLD